MRENFEVRIREIGKLKDGWNFGKGKKFSEEQIEVCAQLANRYYKKHKLSVSGMPSEDGSIELIFNKNDYFLDVKVMPTIRDIKLTFSKGIGKDKKSEDWGSTDIKELDKIFEKFEKAATTR